MCTCIVREALPTGAHSTRPPRRRSHRTKGFCVLSLLLLATLTAGDRRGNHRTCATSRCATHFLRCCTSQHLRGWKRLRVFVSQLFSFVWYVTLHNLCRGPTRVARQNASRTPLLAHCSPPSIHTHDRHPFTVHHLSRTAFLGSSQLRTLSQLHVPLTTTRADRWSSISQQPSAAAAAASTQALTPAWHGRGSPPWSHDRPCLRCRAPGGRCQALRPTGLRARSPAHPAPIRPPTCPPSCAPA